MTFKSENELVPANEDELQIIKKVCPEYAEHEIEVLPGTDIFYAYTKDGYVHAVGVCEKVWKHCGLEVPIWRQEDVKCGVEEE